MKQLQDAIKTILEMKSYLRTAEALGASNGVDDIDYEVMETYADETIETIVEALCVMNGGSWIQTKKELPACAIVQDYTDTDGTKTTLHHSKTVLILAECDQGYKAEVAVYWAEDHIWLSSSDHEYKQGQVVYWMPLPSFPEV